ncbi:MAG: hypothetical protein AUH29_04325 [Candidatus Rokubacteria bacterium 13_1_40CM_69_27]|nr:MAG: hypothetical protein AUH29_04325 [Candidatus Rokubacteria bacterium 13_1_40CM_69_27]OLC36947.1 MAG: hypothetical protein AUH81_07220 [Candidatus Rokubacteria bacterium 13_1_40CM_4_69_5]
MKRVMLFLGVVVLLTARAEAAVTRIEITRREPFAAGQAFGNVGPYEKVVGRFHGELGPTHAVDSGIVDLDMALRNARGRVEYSAGFYILKPVDLVKGNGALFYDVNNRGNKVRLPDLAVPTGTATGWALRAADAGGAGELCYLDGSFVPFAKGKAEREAKADPRRSIEERYRDKADYVAKVRQAAATLQRDGDLLAEDAQRIVDQATAMPW